MNNFLSLIKKGSSYLLERKRMFIPLIIFFIIVGFIAGFYHNLKVSYIIQPYINMLEDKMGIMMEYSDAEFGFPLKIKLHNIKVRYRNKELLKGEEGVLKVPLFSIISRKKKGIFTLTGTGYLEVEASHTDDDLKIKLKTNNFEHYGKYEHPYFTFDYRVDVSGEAKIVLNKKNPADSYLDGKLKINSFVVKDLNIMGTWEVGDFTFKDILLKPETSQGKFLLKDVRVRNKDVEGTVNISLVPSRRLSLSRLNGKVDIRLTPSFIERLKKVLDFPFSKRDIHITVRGPLRSPYIRWK